MERKRAVPLGASLGTVRHFQWLFALVSYLVFARGFRHVRTTFDMDIRVHAVPVLNLITLIYASLALVAVYFSATLPTCRRYRVELGSLVTDLAFAILLLVKSAILNSTRLDCQVLFKDKFLDYGLARELENALIKRVFGLEARFKIDDIDRQCGASLLTYWLCLLAIMSYTLSILLTLVRIREYRRLFTSDKKIDIPGHVEMTIEAWQYSSAPRVSSRSGFRSPSYFPSQSPHRPELPVTHRPRSSQETSSSCSSETLLVADGFRPDDPPAYVSRPASLHSCKGD